MANRVILCVDDERSVLDVLKQQLKARFKSHKIYLASSAEEALDMIDVIEERGDILEVVIADQVMPGMKGDKFLEKVHRKYPEVIKILLTGQASLESAIYAINNAGLSRYIEKPWDGDKLVNEIDSLLREFREHLEYRMLIKQLEERVRELEKKVDKESQGKDGEPDTANIDIDDIEIPPELQNKK
jgi:two-component system chemotaxis response regulator CheY